MCWAADKITVNNVLPLAETWGREPKVPAPTNGLGRFGTPEDDIAPVILFLASKGGMRSIPTDSVSTKLKVLVCLARTGVKSPLTAMATGLVGPVIHPFF